MTNSNYSVVKVQPPASAGGWSDTMHPMTEMISASSLSHLVQGLRVPAVLLDNQHILAYNSSLKKLLALSEQPELNRLTLYLRHLDERPLTLTEILESKTEPFIRALVVTPDKNPELVSLHLTEIPVSADTKWWLITFEAEPTEEDREQTLSSLNLIRTLNHELKQPLTLMKAGLFLLKRKVERSPELEKKLHDMDHHVSQMSLMLTNAVTALKLSQGRLRSKQEKCSLSEIVEKAVENVQPLFPRHRFSLTAGVSIQVLGDKDLLIQALSQVLTNAGIYSPEQSVITIVLAKEDGSAILSVTDLGAGMPPVTLERAAEALFRGMENQPLPYGMGLGLYIASLSTMASGGSMEIVSALKEGTTVTFRLPLTT